MVCWCYEQLECKRYYIDLSFLKAGNYEAEIFKDGINADRDATDYQKKQ